MDPDVVHAADLIRAERWFHHFRHRRPGLTLVEVLVTISLIGILLALTLPAVQSARAAAQATACRANLKQIGIGLHNYHSTHSRFPPGFVTTSAGEHEPGWGWASMLLPQVEQRSLYEQLNPGPVNLRLAAANRADLLQTSLDVFRCPSDPSEKHSDRLRRIFKNDQLQTVAVARANYIGVNGTRLDATRTGFNGVFGKDSGIRLRDITSGTTSTILVGERRTRVSRAAVWCGVNTTSDDVGGAASHFGSVFVLGASSYRINSEAAPDSLQGFSSEHGSGSHFVMADGSAKLTSQHIDQQVLQRLGNRNQ